MTPAQQEKRTRCEVWTRVMGYHRPVSHFNIGKKSEHYSRKHFTAVKAANSLFIQQFSSAGQFSSSNSTQVSQCA